MRMRVFKSEEELQNLATEISKTIMLHEGNEMLKSTPYEEATLYNLAHGALLGLNHGDCREDMEWNGRCQVILDTIELTCLHFLPRCDSYRTLYLPLRKALIEWKKEGSYLTMDCDTLGSNGIYPYRLHTNRDYVSKSLRKYLAENLIDFEHESMPGKYNITIYCNKRDLEKINDFLDEYLAFQ